MKKLSLKALSIEEMEKIEGGSFSWSEFGHGFCQVFGLFGWLAGTTGIVVGGACVISGL